MAIPTISTPTAGWAVNDAIRTAAQATGTSFSYLLATAKVESNLDPRAASGSSSAKGLFQFIDQTWLAMVKEAGPSLGYSGYAAAISKNDAGRYEVKDASQLRAIMALRTDPGANAAMAGAFTRRNAGQLQSRLGRAATDGELYIAHFLGAGGAAKLITQAQGNPSTAAATLFPGAAAANRSIFYDRSGNARSVADVYGVLVGRYEHARASTVGAGQTATAALQTNQAGNDRFRSDAFNEATYQPSASRNAAPMFHGLFQNEAERPAVSRFINDLWTSRPQVAAALSGVTSAMQTAAVVDRSRAIGLFGEGTDSARLFGRKT